MTVTLIAEAGSGPTPSTGIRYPDRMAISLGIGNASSTPVRLRRPPASEPPYDPGSPGVSTPARRTATAFGPRPAHGCATGPVPAVAMAGIAATDIAATGIAASIATTDVAATGIATTEVAATGITATGVVPPAAASAQRYVRICLEVLNGFRPSSHLRVLGGPVEFSTVVSQLSRRRNGRGHFTQQAPDTAATSATAAPANRRAGQPRATPRNAGPTAAVSSPTSAFSPTTDGVVRYGAPASTARRNAPGAAQPFRLLRIRLSEPRDGVAEVVAVLAYAGMSLAMALRLERHGEQWLCTIAQVI